MLLQLTVVYEQPFLYARLFSTLAKLPSVVCFAFDEYLLSF